MSITGKSNDKLKAIRPEEEAAFALRHVEEAAPSSISDGRFRAQLHALLEALRALRDVNETLISELEAARREDAIERRREAKEARIVRVALLAMLGCNLTLVAIMYLR
jgi:hypothetical protein